MHCENRASKNPDSTQPCGKYGKLFKPLGLASHLRWCKGPRKTAVLGSETAVLSSETAVLSTETGDCRDDSESAATEESSEPYGDWAESRQSTMHELETQAGVSSGTRAELRSETAVFAGETAVLSSDTSLLSSEKTVLSSKTVVQNEKEGTSDSENTVRLSAYEEMRE